MEHRTHSLLFALLRSAVCCEKLSGKEIETFSDDQLSHWVEIAKKHDVIHLLALGLKQNELIPNNNPELEKSLLKAVWRYERLNCEFKKMCDILEAHKIPFMPLKGAVMRKYYPEPWMRTSCDIDIFLHENDVEKAADVLINSFGYAIDQKGSHDISLFAPNQTHVELHYDLIEKHLDDASFDVLKRVWPTAKLREGYRYWYEMPEEMFYFYHVAHMAKHFENGGCGIRPVIDLWILDRIDGVERHKRDEMLKQGDLLRFADAVRRLSKAWFEDAEMDTITQQMEAYILCGGVYGTKENRITVQQQKKGGRVKYALSRIFLPYDVIKFHYPILKKHRWLTPFMEVRRWCKLAFCGHVKSSMYELRYNSNISKEKAENAREFLKSIGLQ